MTADAKSDVKIDERQQSTDLVTQNDEDKPLRIYAAKVPTQVNIQLLRLCAYMSRDSLVTLTDNQI